MKSTYNTKDKTHKPIKDKLLQDDESVHNKLEAGLCQQLDNKIEYLKHSSYCAHTNCEQQSKESSQNYLFLYLLIPLIAIVSVFFSIYSPLFEALLDNMSYG
ncbi:hypothetical protein CONCODRAFT_8956 [Conidiobolus coronatus NRRL 28638]|uniref:Uncharacterized protein n=1 Tax=Conidiobolus coronatus (strain ATCC 28846 / CBS 209.66 / NRRL 28638) TaxID=796925 RepID=A0A137P110_CONC2|nr:hypothetical protein CONCODRAFT_8956 [Conidiobolus coronatus NRRL 28638]|eukprot:KXN68745.1 hypothetical protein CONCODRAFT_8956 [Conidiobolus coronatus NRRL 28638]